MSAVRIEPIVRRALHDELAERLRELIRTGELAPNARVPEKHLCERFGVSRTPLREALKVLAVEGWLVLQPQRGARVASLSQEQLDHTEPVLLALEGILGKTVCAALDEPTLAALERSHQRLIEAYRNDDINAYLAENRQFHEGVLNASANPVLQSTYRGLADRLGHARFRRAMSPAQWRESMDDHERLIEALRQRDGERLAAALIEHSQHKFASLRAHGLTPVAASLSD